MGTARTIAHFPRLEEGLQSPSGAGPILWRRSSAPRCLGSSVPIARGHRLDGRLPHRYNVFSPALRGGLHFRRWTERWIASRGGAKGTEKNYCRATVFLRLFRKFPQSQASPARGEGLDRGRLPVSVVLEFPGGCLQNPRKRVVEFPYSSPTSSGVAGGVVMFSRRRRAACSQRPGRPKNRPKAWLRTASS